MHALVKGLLLTKNFLEEPDGTVQKQLAFSNVCGESLLFTQQEEKVVRETAFG